MNVSGIFSLGYGGGCDDCDHGKYRRKKHHGYRKYKKHHGYYKKDHGDGDSLLDLDLDL